MVLQSGPRNLFAPYLHHSFRDISPDNPLGPEDTLHLDSQIACARCDIQNLFGGEGTEETDAPPTPAFIKSEREGMVQHVVLPRDSVEHTPDLDTFVLFLVVWEYFF